MIEVSFTSCIVYEAIREEFIENKDSDSGVIVAPISRDVVMPLVEA